MSPNPTVVIDVIQKYQASKSSIFSILYKIEAGTSEQSKIIKTEYPTIPLICAAFVSLTIGPIVCETIWFANKNIVMKNKGTPKSR